MERKHLNTFFISSESQCHVHRKVNCRFYSKLKLLFNANIWSNLFPSIILGFFLKYLYHCLLSEATPGTVLSQVEYHLEAVSACPRAKSRCRIRTRDGFSAVRCATTEPPSCNCGHYLPWFQAKFNFYLDITFRMSYLGSSVKTHLYESIYKTHTCST